MFVVTAIGIGVLASFELVPPAAANVTIASLVVGAAGILAIWCTTVKRFPIWLRIAPLLVLILGTGLLSAMVRVTGFTGDLIPTFAWYWSSKPDAVLQSGAPAGKQVAEIAASEAAQYNQFLGPHRRGTLPGIRLKTDWDANPPRLLWRQPIGAGWSAFAVAGRYAFTQEQRGQQELVTCYETATGRLIWSHADELRYNSVVAGDGPRATPTVHSGRVHAIGATGRLSCLDAATGEPVWQRDFQQEFQARIPEYGYSASPLVVADRLITVPGGPDGFAVVAFDLATGEIRWRSGKRPSSYASPTVATLAGEQHVLIVHEDALIAYDPVDGAQLWNHLWPGENYGDANVSQPVVIGDDRVLLSKAYGVGCRLLQVEHRPGAAQPWRIHTLWQNHHLKTKFTNVVVRDDYAYGLDEGILVCLDLADGSRRWKRGRYGHGQIMLVGPHLLIQAESGEVVLVEATPAAHCEVARLNALDSKTWNNPALQGPHLLLRNDREAVCFEISLAASGAIAGVASAANRQPPISEPETRAAERTGARR